VIGRTVARLLAATMLLAASSMIAEADIHIGVRIGLPPVVPPPVYYGPPPAYYSPPPPVYYGPGVVYGGGDWDYDGDARWRGRGWAHDRWHDGWHRGDDRWHH
jgi:hypothetical protein